MPPAVGRRRVRSNDRFRLSGVCNSEAAALLHGVPRGSGDQLDHDVEADHELIYSLEGVALAQRIFLLPGVDAPRRLVFCAADRATDSADVCVRAAQALASQIAGSVCLVDADVYSPDLHRVLKEHQQPGYFEAAAGSSPITAYVSRVEQDRLWVLPAGSVLEGDGDSVHWSKVPFRIDELCRNFRYVLVNAPAVNPLAGFSPHEKLAFAVREAFLARNGVSCWLEPVAGDLKTIITAVQRVLNATAERSLRTVLFSNLDGAKDCSLACVRAGQMLAVGSTARTCIVDADFRRPVLHQHFSLSNPVGMADLFQKSSRADEYLRPLRPSNLWFLGAGFGPTECRATLQWDRVRVLLAELSAQFDYVVIRGPSLESSVDSIVLGGFTDGMVLIVEESQTKRGPAEDLVARIRQARVEVHAAVVIRRGNRSFQIRTRSKPTIDGVSGRRNAPQSMPVAGTTRSSAPSPAGDSGRATRSLEPI